MPRIYRRQAVFKRLLLIFVAVVFLIVFPTVFSSYRFYLFSRSIINDDLAKTVNAVKSHFTYYKNNTNAAAVSVSKNPDLIKAVEKGERSKAITILIPLLNLYNVNYFLIFDTNGAVHARTNDQLKYGDDVSEHQSVKNALNGMTSTFYDTGAAAKVAIRTSAPIYNGEGELIGGISAGIQLDNNKVLDDLKKEYSSDISVFLGDTRIATTITKDGKRAVGAKLNKDVVENAIYDKREYVSEAVIFGVKYTATYIPLIDADNEAFAVVGVGNSYAKIDKQTDRLIIDNIIVGFTGLAILIIILRFLALNNTKKAREN